ncbi:hypothetical protein MJ585_21445 [Klebsiella pneumoniae]|nr:hypothetical protein MJ585_21445 [Klebsiella pneumoniae]
MIEFEVYIDEVFAFSQRSDGLILHSDRLHRLLAVGWRPILTRRRWTPSPWCRCSRTPFPARPLVINGDSSIRLHASLTAAAIWRSAATWNRLPIQDGGCPHSPL